MNAQPQLALTDQQLEQAIDLAALRLATASTHKRRVQAWDELTSLVAARSPDQVARMERAKGLRQ